MFSDAKVFFLSTLSYEGINSSMFCFQVQLLTCKIEIQPSFLDYLKGG